MADAGLLSSDDDMADFEVDTIPNLTLEGLAQPHSARPYLFVALECGRLWAGGARYALAGVDEVLIGRGRERRVERRHAAGVSRLHVQIPGRWMSQTHARLLRTPEGWVLEDAGSTNGAFLNGQRIDRAVLCDGDSFELGHTLFVLREALSSPPFAAPDFDSLHDAVPDPRLATSLPALAHDFRNLVRAARSDLSIVLQGESGTGKELVSRAIHHLSERPGPFLAVNCGAFTASLLESQLFGYVKGGFSGATRDEPGFFRAAEQGTLLLDEIGDLPLASQPSLLRVLQEREVTPVGSSRGQRIDVRVIAATHRPLAAWTTDQRFRPDLLARLTGYTLTLPPLSARREDIGIFLANLLSDTPAASGIVPSSLQLTPEAGRALLLDRWPLNTRELAQHFQRALVLAKGPIITLDDLALSGRPTVAARSGTTRSSRPPSETDIKLKRDLLSALEEHHGNVAGVARAMGKKRMQIQRWLRRFDLQPGVFRVGK